MLEKLKLDKRGFTLVELIVVVVILGVLMAVLVPHTSSTLSAPV